MQINTVQKRDVKYVGQTTLNPSNTSVQNPLRQMLTQDQCMRFLMNYGTQDILQHSFLK